MENKNLSDLRVIDLKKELEKRGLSKSGTKKDLVDRLRSQMEIEQLRITTTGEADAPSLQIAGDEQNEFVKNYLQQRQKLLSQQLEQKKRFEAEEASRSQSECETDEGDAAAAAAAVKAAEPQVSQLHDVNQSDEDTDVESAPEVTNQSVSISTTVDEKIVNAGVVTDEQLDNVEPSADASSSEIHSAAAVEENKVGEVDSDRDMNKTPPRMPSRSLSRSRSNSRSVSQDRQDDSPSRPSARSSRSRSQSASSRSSSDRSRSKSPSPSEKSRSESRKSEERQRSASKSPVQSRSPSVNKLNVMETVAVEIAISDENREVVLAEKDEDAAVTGNSITDLVETEQTSVASLNHDKKDESKVVTDNSCNQEGAKPARKRRWGSASVQSIRPSIVISTDSLKGLIPDIDPGLISIETPMELEERGDISSKDEDVESDEPRVIIVKNKEQSEQEDTRAAKVRRIVHQDSVSPGARKSEADMEEGITDNVEESAAANGIRTVKAPSVAVAEESNKKTEVTDRVVRVNRTVSLTVDDPVDVGRKSPSPSRHPPSNVVHVTGLVRPFTLGQLKDLLGRTGTLQSDGFWIDSIKSHCYAVYETVDQAEATRRALHGKRWPSSNPKLLGVDFRTMEEFEKRKNNEIIHGGPSNVPVTVEKTTVQQPSAELEKTGRSGLESRKDTKKSPRDTSKSSVKENKDKINVPMREWDRHKLRQSRSSSRERLRKEDKTRNEARDRKEVARRDQQRSKDDRRGHGRTEKAESGAKIEEEPPAKLLDDLFRKTVAMPCIYWLPLTDEQVNEKLAQEKQEKLLREQRRAEREQQFEAERQQRLKAREERTRQAEPRDRQPAQRRKFSESEDQFRRRGRSRSGGRADRR